MGYRIKSPADFGCAAVLLIVSLIGLGGFGLGYSYWADPGADTKLAEQLQGLRQASLFAIVAGSVATIVAIVLYKLKNN